MRNQQSDLAGRVGDPNLCFCHGGYPQGFESVPGAVIGDDRPATIDWVWKRPVEVSTGFATAIVETKMAIGLCDECCAVWRQRYADGEHPPGATYEVRSR